MESVRLAHSIMSVDPHLLVVTVGIMSWNPDIISWSDPIPGPMDVVRPVGDRNIY